MKKWTCRSVGDKKAPWLPSLPAETCIIKALAGGNGEHKQDDSQPTFVLTPPGTGSREDVEMHMCTFPATILLFFFLEKYN